MRVFIIIYLISIDLQQDAREHIINEMNVPFNLQFSEYLVSYRIV